MRDRDANQCSTAASILCPYCARVRRVRHIFPSLVSTRSLDVIAAAKTPATRQRHGFAQTAASSYSRSAYIHAVLPSPLQREMERKSAHNLCVLLRPRSFCERAGKFALLPARKNNYVHAMHIRETLSLKPVRYTNALLLDFSAKHALSS
jgi:hypothetical protein